MTRFAKQDVILAASGEMEDSRHAFIRREQYEGYETVLAPVETFNRAPVRLLHWVAWTWWAQGKNTPQGLCCVSKQHITRMYRDLLPEGRTLCASATRCFLALCELDIFYFALLTCTLGFESLSGSIPLRTDKYARTLIEYMRDAAVHTSHLLLRYEHAALSAAVQGPWAALRSPRIFRDLHCRYPLGTLGRPR